MSETVTGHRGGGSTVATLLRVGSHPVAHRGPEPGERGRTLRVRSAMKEVPDGIEASATLEDAEDRMDALGVNWLPVLDSGRLVGLITRLDIRSARETAGHSRAR